MGPAAPRNDELDSMAISALTQPRVTMVSLLSSTTELAAGFVHSLATGSRDAQVGLGFEQPGRGHFVNQLPSQTDTP